MQFDSALIILAPSVVFNIYLVYKYIINRIKLKSIRHSMSRIKEAELKYNRDIDKLIN